MTADAYDQTLFGEPGDCVRSTALHALELGYAPLPVTADGTKRPAVAWAGYTVSRPTVADVGRWFANGTQGVGLVCGAVSGGLEMLELEGRAVNDGYLERVNDLLAVAGLADLAERVAAGYTETTPSDGLHWLYRIADGVVPGNTKLARRVNAETGEVEVLAETRGEGGFVVTSPSNGMTHETGRPWVLTAGGLEQVVTITRAERDELVAIFRLLDEMPAPTGETFTAPAETRCGHDGDRPGDRLNAEGRPEFRRVLERRGWMLVFERDGVDYWRRPGKTNGISATVADPGKAGRVGRHGTLKCFSSSTRFDTERTYDLLGTLAVLEHGGDVTAAARSLTSMSSARVSDANIHDTPMGETQSVRTHDLSGATNLPGDFWSSRPELGHIERAAFGRGISPDAVLGCVLARVVALTHHSIVLPPIVGRVGALNLFIAFVGVPGDGKGSAADAADALIAEPPPIGGHLAGRFREVTAGSGEGLVRAFFERRTVTDNKTGNTTRTMVQTTWNAVVRIDEGEMLARLAKRQDQTTMTVVRQAWSGERLGASYADEDKNLHLPAHGYRLCIVLGVQPELGRFLLDDTASGTPQRFTFLPGRHPGIPQPASAPEWPGALRWRPPTRPADARGAVEVTVADEVADELRSAHHARITGSGPGDPMAGHAGLRRLKVAAALAILNGRLDVGADDWRLAGIVETTSSVVRSAMAEAVAAEDNAKARVGDRRAVGRELAVAEALEAREAVAVERVAKILVRRVRKLGGKATARELHHATASRDRVRLAEATDWGIHACWLKAVEADTFELGDRHQEVPDAAA